MYACKASALKVISASVKPRKPYCLDTKAVLVRKRHRPRHLLPNLCLRKAFGGKSVIGSYDRSAKVRVRSRQEEKAAHQDTK